MSENVVYHVPSTPLYDPKASDEDRYKAVVLMHYTQGDWIGPLSQAALQDSDKSIRIAAMRALGNTLDARTAGTLVKGLQDKEQEVRAEAANALTHVQQIPGNDLQVIQQLFAPDVRPSTMVQEARLSCIAQLGASRSPYAVLPLATLAAHPDTNIAKKAQASLKTLHDSSSLALTYRVLASDMSGKDMFSTLTHLQTNAPRYYKEMGDPYNAETYAQIARSKLRGDIKRGAERVFAHMLDMKQAGAQLLRPADAPANAGDLPVPAMPASSAPGQEKELMRPASAPKEKGWNR